MSTKTHLLALASIGVLATALTDVACSTSFEPRICVVDDDCGGSLVCDEQNGQSVCVKPETAPLRIGQSAPGSGPSQDLGLEMKRGILLAFDQQNQQGGIRGRPLTLDFRDDQYTPTLAEQNARALVDAQPGPGAPRCPTTQTPPAPGDPFSQNAIVAGPKSVVAVMGSVGTPTMVRSAPIIVEADRLYFGAFTGATAMLRDTKAGPCSKNIFNVRASYAQEARATLEFFFSLGVQDDKHLLSFDQNDTFGDAGYNGLVAAYTALKNVPPNITRFRYTRDDITSVPGQATATITYLKSLLTGDTAAHNVGIMMTDTYGPGSQYIKLLKDWQYANDAEQTSLQKATRLVLHYSNVSFVGPNSLAGRLHDFGQVQSPSGPKAYTEEVYVSQVVPNYESDNSDVVLDYKRLIPSTGASPTFTSLEGYIAARVFIEGLQATKGAFTAENMESAFENLPPSTLGLGASAGFTKDVHQYSKSVWGTSITPDGGFQNRYFWSDGVKIQLFE
jgi:ABC-type branched-subunit amino acid transport system substrate-binding protein